MHVNLKSESLFANQMEVKASEAQGVTVRLGLKEAWSKGVS